jgi:hypothetical protein
MRYAKSHTHIDLARWSILLAFLVRRSIVGSAEEGGRRRFVVHDKICSRFWLLHAYKWGQERDIDRVETYSFKNPPPGGGKAKGSASVTEKLQHNVVGFLLAYSSWCQEVLGYLSLTQLIYHKDFSSSHDRGMRNPITHITRILLATERTRRRNKREKQKFAPYKIYSLCHS